MAHMIVQVRKEQAALLIDLRREVEEAEARLNACCAVLLAGIAPTGSHVEKVTLGDGGCGFVEYRNP